MPLTLEHQVAASMAGGNEVRFSGAVLREVAAHAEAGFNRISHGGIEVGGVLYGKRVPGGVLVAAARFLDCEYALGPGFQLSPADRINFARLQDLPGEDPDLAGMQPVGWFRSRTRSELTFGESDAALHREFFPEPWQITLVLRPAKAEPTRMSVFAPGSSGTDGTPVEPPGSLPDPERQNGAGLKPMGRPGSPENGASSGTAPETGELMEVPDEPGPPEAEAFEEQTDSLPKAREQRHHGAFWAMVALCALMAASAIVGFFIWQANRPLSVRTEEVNGQLRIDWDRGNRAVREATGAILEIRDGDDQPYRIPFTAEELRSGSVTYAPRTQHVEVRLILEGLPETVEARAAGYELTMTVPSAAGEPPGHDTGGTPSGGTPALDPEFSVPEAEQLPSEPPMVTGTATSAQSKPVPQTAAARAAPERGREAGAASPAATRSGQPIAKPSDSTNPAPVLAARPGSSPVSQGSGDIQSPTSGATAPAIPPSQAEQPQELARNIPPPVQAPQLPQVQAPPQAQPRVQPQAQPPPASAKPPPSRPRSGRIIWTGQLRKGESLVLRGNQASSGAVTGELPATPVYIRAYPGELGPGGITLYSSNPDHRAGAAEAPAAHNGWNRTAFRWDPRRANGVIVLEPPNAQRGWNTATLRSDGGAHSVIVIEWQSAE